MKITTKRRLIILVVFIFSIVAMLTLASFQQPQQKKPKTDRALFVEALTLQSETIQFEVISQGTVQPKISTSLSSEVSGRIIYISDHFVAGGMFEADEVLLRIDPTDYQVAVEQARALVKQRRLEYQGAKSLRKQGYRAESELASAEASLAAAKASLVKAEKNLDRTEIRLPFKGMVREKMADLGQYVNPGSKVAQTFSTETAEVRLPLTDKDLSFLNLGNAHNQSSDNPAQLPKLTLTAIQKGKLQQWQAHIVRTEGVVDERSRVTYAVAEVLDPYLRNQTLLAQDAEILPIGTYVSASIAGIKIDNIVKVPRKVLRGKNELLFIDDENKLRIRAVDILRTDDHFAYITKGVKDGEQIVLTSIGSPINGMLLRTEAQVDKPVTTEQSNQQEEK